MEHNHVIKTKPGKIPSSSLPDGAFLGNGDLSVIWGGSTDRIHIYISKSDFWNAEERDGHNAAGISPLGIIEILLPQFAYSPYHVEQNMDEGKLIGRYTADNFDAVLTVVVCADENTILIELDRTFPALSSSVELLPLTENSSAAENETIGGIRYITRSFDSPELYFATHGIAVLKEVSRRRENGREIIRHAVTVATNHDTAAYRNTAIERLGIIDDAEFDVMLENHAKWWSDFWAKSSVSISDEFMENMWYTGMYVMACCARNRKFAPGLWGNFATSDKMGWFGDYHLNYNYELPFSALMTSNHTELLDCYDTPLLDFLPRAKRYSREYLGCRGSYFPVCIGPIGMETDIRNAKEHKHLFLGQKSDGLFASLIMISRWYGTRDTDYAKRAAYPFLVEQANFWEDYLTFKDGRYFAMNDCIHEVEWWESPDHMPKEQDQYNNAMTLCFIRVLLRALIDITDELGIDGDRHEKWNFIMDHLSPIPIGEDNGKKFIAVSETCGNATQYFLWFVNIAGTLGPYSDPEMYQIARNSLEKIGGWIYDQGNIFSTAYASSVRLGADGDMLIGKFKDTMSRRLMQNGLIEYSEGGIENCAAAPSMINEMLLQSWDNVIRLFPCHDPSDDASFTNLRAYGAFLVSASIRNGVIDAEIISEKGRDLSIKKPDGGVYALVGSGDEIILSDAVTTVKTSPGEHLKLIYHNGNER